jgi:glycosyltransferase involved in cell wall biosynthesis
MNKTTILIGIDGNEANVARKVGISEYAFELLKQFKEFQISNIKFQIYLKDVPREDMPKEGENWKYIVVRPGRFWTQIGLPLYLYTHNPKPQVFFSLTHYSPRFSPVPTVMSVMDLAFLRFPETFNTSDLYQLKSWTAYSVKKATKIFTISEASKNDILKYYQIPESRVVVTHLGIKPVSSMEHQLSVTDVKKKYSLDTPYYLFVSTLQPRKNIVRLIEAFSTLKDQETILVIVGKKGWLYEPILAAPEKYGVKDRVKFLDFAPNEDLPGLYKGAIAYVFPSLYEGFGLTLLEAMKYDCPVITSNVSSLPEAGGDAALYVDPEKVDSIAQAMEKITDKKVREDLIKKGHEQIKKFSWEKTARETLQVLEEVVSSK